MKSSRAQADRLSMITWRDVLTLEKKKHDRNNLSEIEDSVVSVKRRVNEIDITSLGQWIQFNKLNHLVQ